MFTIPFLIAFLISFALKFKFYLRQKIATGCIYCSEERRFRQKIVIEKTYIMYEMNLRVESILALFVTLLKSI